MAESARSEPTDPSISSRANGILSAAQRELILGTQLADLMVRFPEVVAELQKSRRKVGSDGAVCGAYSCALRALAELERHLAARPQSAATLALTTGVLSSTAGAEISRLPQPYARAGKRLFSARAFPEQQLAIIPSRSEPRPATSDWPAALGPCIAGFRMAFHLLEPTIFVVQHMRRPVYVLLQLEPLCLVLSVFGWLLASFAYLCEHPGLLVDLMVHLLTSFPSYFSYAIPRILTRAESSIFEARPNATATSAPSIPPPQLSFWLGGAPLAFLWWARWGWVWTYSLASAKWLPTSDCEPAMDPRSSI